MAVVQYQMAATWPPHLLAMCPVSGSTSYFEAGHRLRLEVSSSNFPCYDRNHNTGHELGADAETRPAQQTVFHDNHSPSHLILPVIPR